MDSITRKEFPHGWQVSFKMNGLIAKRAIQRKWFGDRKWGGKEAALAAAQKYTNSLIPNRRIESKKQQIGARAIIREVGKVWGWRVDIIKHGTKTEKFFSDKDCGGIDESLEAAKNFLKSC